MRIVFLLIALHMLLSGAVFAQADPQLEAPRSIDEAKQGVLRVGDKIAEGLLGIIPGIWKNQVLPAWKGMWMWVQETLWQERLQPGLQRLVDKGREFLGQEIEKRKPLVEQQLQEEKQELQEELEQGAKNVKAGLWERFLNLFRE